MLTYPAHSQQRTVASIFDFLHTIRRPYLASSSAPSRRNATAEADGKHTLDTWRGVNSLTDKERDEIDFQVKMTIKKCLARIKELEEGENGEQTVSIQLITTALW